MTDPFSSLKIVNPGIEGFLWLSGFGVTVILGVVLLKLAPRIGFLDNPELSERKIHKKPKPLAGLVVYLGFLPAYLFAADAPLPLSVSLSLVFLTGAIDDLWDLDPGLKLFFQIIAAVVLVVWVSTPVTVIGVSEGINLRTGGILNYLIIIFWLVGGTNAINLIDGLDGLAGGLSLIALIPILLLTIGQPISIAAGLGVACMIGFLIFNFYPAKLFLGDGGSYLLGFLTSYLVLFGLSGVNNSGVYSWPLLPGLLLLGLPVIDTAWAIIRRLKSHSGVMEPDDSHIHHRLYFKYGHFTAVVAMYLIQSVFALISVLAFR